LCCPISFRQFLLRLSPFRNLLKRKANKPGKLLKLRPELRQPPISFVSHRGYPGYPGCPGHPTSQRQPSNNTPTCSQAIEHLLKLSETIQVSKDQQGQEPLLAKNLPKPSNVYSAKPRGFCVSQ